MGTSRLEITYAQSSRQESRVGLEHVELKISISGAATNNMGLETKDKSRKENLSSRVMGGGEGKF